MQQGLFESITGRFMDGTPLDSLGAGQRRLRSVIDHLQRLCNSREGSLPHLPGHGLPDISQVYRTLPGGAESLREAIRIAVERYEPRLSTVRVVRLPADMRHGRLSFMLSANLRGVGAIRLQTSFANGGEASIEPWRLPAGEPPHA